MKLKRKKMMFESKKQNKVNFIFDVLFLIILIIIIFIYIFGNNRLYKKIYIKNYSEYVYKYAKEYEVDPYLIFAVIKNESQFNEKVVSNSGAIGLMQVMESTGKEVAYDIAINEYISDFTLYNPEKNIQIGTKYLSQLIEKYNGNYLLSLAAYNAGKGTVDLWIEDEILKVDGSDIENIPYKETNMYVRKVNRDYNIYKKIYE